ncbi:DUF2075 domain-containing protein [Flavobacterium coralii]|uniref:DUF2075 domain-containing protein n=1 Tax=Flavobacterium coralii TaxID=2838017 RepID=UPI000C6B4866|nr:hypothetical protein [Flavobacterium sp.]|tara:strand:+ start:34590 stop:36563 length:1974 start_codon:yes stop_codon:yes gene_type:complete
MKRFYYSNTITEFLNSSDNEIIGIIVKNDEYDSDKTQKDAWLYQIDNLKQSLKGLNGQILFEYSIPRMGRRVDVILVINQILFLIEYKVGEKNFTISAIDQVWDYALDLKNFHSKSHTLVIAPILLATNAKNNYQNTIAASDKDNVLFPLKSNASNIRFLIDDVLSFIDSETISYSDWSEGRYSPTPTIIEAAIALYSEHSVAEISRSDAEATNLTLTSNTISEIIANSKTNSQKSICFVTGVPGAGKTLVGLNIATKNLDREKHETSVFLSGNGPLVAILREALTRDAVKRKKAQGKKVKKGEEFSRVKLFIQNVHHFRDEYLRDAKAPFDHIAIFDEAQRAWNLQQTMNFMQRKRSVPDFSQSEPEFLISCMDRHEDWAVIVCLVGGGQQINTGEAGIKEWIESLNRSFPEWKIFVSSKLTDTEYAAGEALKLLENKPNVSIKDELHLAVSMRSFRAEHLSALVKNVLDINIPEARLHLNLIQEKYPIVITRNLHRAKSWLKEKARGSERYGIIVSSNAQRLKPHAIDVKSPLDPIHWFLDEKDDVRSSYYLEDVATEFHVQGLELDWACITWDADFRFSENGWLPYSFVGTKWHNVKKGERKLYLKNAYRVLLTRARQGMVIVVPEGDKDDPTRKNEYYDSTYNYLKEIGFNII